MKLNRVQGRVFCGFEITKKKSNRVRLQFVSGYHKMSLFVITVGIFGEG